MQVVFSQNHNPAFNLAAEMHLFSKKEMDFLLLYRNDKSVIVGSNQEVSNEADVDFCAQNSIEILRRHSGGGAVFHDLGNLNFCFIRNLTENCSPLTADFLQPIVETLAIFDIPVQMGKRRDLWLNGYKISGTASYIRRHRVLQHGTLLYNTDLQMLAATLNPKTKDLTKKGTPSVSAPVCNISDFLWRSKGTLPLSTANFFDSFTRILANRYSSEIVTI